MNLLILSLDIKGSVPWSRSVLGADCFPEKLQSELICSLSCIVIQWLTQSSTAKNSHQRKQWREVTSKEAPCIHSILNHLKALFTHLTWSSCAQSYEINQAGVSSWLMGNQVTWEKPRLPCFSVSELGPEAKLQLQVQLTWHTKP